MPQEQRRLAAIVAADVVGYSRLKGRDERGTLAALNVHRRELVDPLVTEHGGRVVKSTGDGLLLEFPSVVDAVRCAVAIQDGMMKRNVGVADDNRILFRVGVNVGDVIVEGDDIFGDGVNVAARLETLADAGGICISDRVYRDVRGRLEAEFTDSGEQALKNIAEPVRVWRWTGISGSAVSLVRPIELALPDKPSIAVLPFQNMSGDAEQEYFADGVVEEITTALSRFRSLFVIARNSSFTYKGRAVDVKQVGRELGVRYVLEGSVRKAAGRVRITAQLVDALNGAHLWADRVDGALEDVFDLQDQVTEKVVSAIAPQMERAEIARSRRKTTVNLDAYDCYLRALGCRSFISKDDVDECLRLLYRAIELDPDFAAAYGLAAECYAVRKAAGWFAGTENETAEAMRLTRAAVKAGQVDAEALAYAAFAFAYVLNDLQSGRAFVDQALALNPNLAVAWGNSGWIRLWEGDPNVALKHIGRAMRLGPLGINYSRSASVAAHACFFLDKHGEALGWASKALKDQPDFHPALRIATASAALAGLDDLAKQMRTRLLAVDPAFSVSRLVHYLAPYQNPDFPAKYAEGLRKAGLPE